MTIKLQQLDNNRWRIPRQGAMLSDGLIYASEAMIPKLHREQALEQVYNVACLPGIVGPALAMPDIHWGYGFPIGGVAAFDAEAGVVSPGGVGYDINCGVRLLRSALTAEQIKPHLPQLADALFQEVPSGVGSHRRNFKLSDSDLSQVLTEGAGWAVKKGYGSASDLECIENNGALAGADPEKISARAMERGRNQLGTLGSGNHFLEIQEVEAIHDEAAAQTLGLFCGQVTVSIHTGSRGLGYQVCDDSLKGMLKAARKYNISLPDRQLCCAPLTSPEAADYLAAMACAANFAFANRQLICDQTRDVFSQVMDMGEAELRLNTIYDVCHNIAKWEKHRIDGKERKLCVHRKGATRAFPPGHPELPAAYRGIGQPVLVPGDMGRYSYVLTGTAGAYEQTFGSCCHGAGRVMSRHAAKKAARGHDIIGELAQQGILVRAAGRGTVAEEMPSAYKDVAEVVKVVEQAGLGKIVARLRPLAVIKG
ncbi:MAG: RtcB family protein [Desulfuromonadales bacterium]|nr:RtcB family protein [Desulfuromonadales bacterium]